MSLKLNWKKKSSSDSLSLSLFFLLFLSLRFLFRVFCVLCGSVLIPQIDMIRWMMMQGVQ